MLVHDNYLSCAMMQRGMIGMRSLNFRLIFDTACIWTNRGQRVLRRVGVSFRQIAAMLVLGGKAAS